MRFASLGSGSRGNATLIEYGNTRLLVDCGFSFKETCARLSRFGLGGGDLTAIVVTHGHHDHISGVGVVARALNLAVWLTPGTLRECEAQGVGSLPDIRLFSSDEPFSVDGVEVTPFSVPHDAREPCQFVFYNGRYRVGVLTDTGGSTPHIEQQLSGCDALLIECNHDRGMLVNGPYPPALKERISGPYGHLDNTTAAQLLVAVGAHKVQHLVAMHLSEVNNRPELVRSALDQVLGCDEAWIKVADQEAGLDWCELKGR